jgi:hypothetical protein
MRLTLLRRDALVIRIFHGKAESQRMIEDHDSRLTSATNILTDQMIEASGKGLTA